jgi:hypothetical protein
MITEILLLYEIVVSPVCEVLTTLGVVGGVGEVGQPYNIFPRMGDILNFSKDPTVTAFQRMHPLLYSIENTIIINYTVIYCNGLRRSALQCLYGTYST